MQAIIKKKGGPSELHGKHLTSQPFHGITVCTYLVKGLSVNFFIIYFSLEGNVQGLRMYSLKVVYCCVLLLPC